MSYCLLFSDVCSLGHCVASWTSTLSGSNCDVAVRHSNILTVARAFRTWASACCVLHPVLLHPHIGLFTFPCLWQRGSFPHLLPFCATDTASTLTASWSRWSLVTSVPISIGFGIWLDWLTPTTLHVAVLGATVWNVDAVSQSLGIRSGTVRSIQAWRCFVHVRMFPFPTPNKTVTKCVRPITFSARICEYHAYPEESFICGKDIVNYLIPCRFSGPRNRCFPQVFPYCRPGCLWP